MPERRDLGFGSGGETLSAWHLPGEGDAFAGELGRPCVVMATGMGGTKDSGLLPFAEAFASAGLDALAFDYRGFGESGGEPRQLAWPARHREDLGAAIEFARGLEGVDPGRIVLWGWSWGASHVIYRAAADPSAFAALVLVGPDADGLATMRHLTRQGSPRQMLRLNAAAARDFIAQSRGEPPELIPMVGPPGSFAALTTHESEPGYKTLAGPTWRNEVSAKMALAEWGNRAVGRVERLRCPILVQGGEHDTIVPPEVPRKVVWEAKGRSELREYPCGHWDFLLGQRERVIADELHFLRRQLAASPDRDEATSTA